MKVQKFTKGILISINRKTIVPSVMELCEFARNLNRDRPSTEKNYKE